MVTPEPRILCKQEVLPCSLLAPYNTLGTRSLREATANRCFLLLPTAGTWPHPSTRPIPEQVRGLLIRAGDTALVHNTWCHAGNSPLFSGLLMSVNTQCRAYTGTEG